MESRIKGKVVAITGASSGIGAATALMLAAQGAKVVLGARRSDRLEELSGRIAKVGGEAGYLVTDVKQRNDLVKLVQLAWIPITGWKFTRKVLRNTFLQKGKAARKSRLKRTLQSKFIFQTTI